MTRYSKSTVRTAVACFVSLIVILLSTPVSHGQDGLITLEKVTGLVRPGFVGSKVKIKFHFRVTNNTENVFNCSNGFRVYSPDGAEWDTTVATAAASYVSQWSDYLIDAFGSPLGSGADTVRFVGIDLSLAGGLQPGYDNTVLFVEIGPVGVEHIGRTICIDSSQTPPASAWYWAGKMPGVEPQNVIPYWGGPYCFTISDGCCVGERAGNIDYDPDDLVDLGDLTRLIDFLFITTTPPECLSEANVDGNQPAIVDFDDLTALIDYLYISFTPPAPCQ